MGAEETQGASVGGARWVIVVERDEGPATALELDRALWRAALLAEDPRHIMLAAPSDDPSLAPVLGTWPTIRRVSPPTDGGSLPAVAVGLRAILEIDPDATVVVLPTALGDEGEAGGRSAEPLLPDDCAACGPLLRAAADLGERPQVLVTLALEVSGAAPSAAPADLLPTGAFVAQGQTLAERLASAAPAWWSALAAPAEPRPAPARIAEVIATTPPEMLGLAIVPAAATSAARDPHDAPLAPLLENR